MSYTFNELTVIEHALGRTVRSLRQMGIDADAGNRLANAEYIMAEVRHAGMWLCDPACTPEMRQQALDRLAALFENKANHHG